MPSERGRDVDVECGHCGLVERRESRICPTGYELPLVAGECFGCDGDLCDSCAASGKPGVMPEADADGWVYMGQMVRCEKAPTEDADFGHSYADFRRCYCESCHGGGYRHCRHCGTPWVLGDLVSSDGRSEVYETANHGGQCFLCRKSICKSCAIPGKPGRPPEDWFARSNQDIPWERIAPCDSSWKGWKGKQRSDVR
jgi:hypothetical protein